MALCWQTNLLYYNTIHWRLYINRSRVPPIRMCVDAMRVNSAIKDSKVPHCSCSSQVNDYC